MSGSESVWAPLKKFIGDEECKTLLTTVNDNIKRIVKDPTNGKTCEILEQFHNFATPIINIAVGLKAANHRLEIEVGELKAANQRLELEVGDLKAANQRAIAASQRAIAAEREVSDVKASELNGAYQREVASQQASNQRMEREVASLQAANQRTTTEHDASIKRMEREVASLQAANQRAIAAEREAANQRVIAADHEVAVTIGQMSEMLKQNTESRRMLMTRINELQAELNEHGIAQIRVQAPQVQAPMLALPPAPPAPAPPVVAPPAPPVVAPQPAPSSNSSGHTEENSHANKKQKRKASS